MFYHLIHRKSETELKTESITFVICCIFTVADPGFGEEGGPRNFFRDFADVVK